MSYAVTLAPACIFTQLAPRPRTSCLGGGRRQVHRRTGQPVAYRASRRLLRDRIHRQHGSTYLDQDFRSDPSQRVLWMPPQPAAARLGHDPDSAATHREPVSSARQPSTLAAIPLTLTPNSSLTNPWMDVSKPLGGARVRMLKPCGHAWCVVRHASRSGVNGWNCRMAISLIWTGR